MTSVFGDKGTGRVDLANHQIDAVRAVAGHPLGSKLVDVIPATEPIRCARSARVLSDAPTLPGLFLVTDQRVLMLQEAHDWSVRVGASRLSDVRQVSVERLQSSAALHVRTTSGALVVTSREPNFALPLRDHLLAVCPSASSPDLDYLAQGRAPLSIDSPNLPLHLGACRYLGGITSQPSALDSLTTEVCAAGVAVGPIPLPWRVIQDLWVYGPDSTGSKVTVPRVLLLGVLALAVPKKTKQSFLVIDTEQGQAVVECHSHTNAELHGQIEFVRTRLRAEQGQREAPFGSGAPDVATVSADRAEIIHRIRELGVLLDEGLITDREFEDKKSELLGRL